MKHNERISPEARIVYPEHFLFCTLKDSKTCRCCAFYLSTHSLSLLLFCFSPKDPWNDWHSSLLSHASNIQQALLWNYTDLGQRLISLSLLTNPGLRVCILLALRPLWFNIALPDMTSHHRQRLGDMTLVSCDKEMVVFSVNPINHTWTIRQQKRDGSKLWDY